ncbi:hypothetical protein RRG08_043330 [Elysia crispata]|uniref:Uncharacterized protein n=1 Tax=Elysia crispata TaxID=231223 RepID=A0AAE1ECF7_9GAST|nr:hypothetical protein RRG08_043330 [Elysia crispata]
MYKYNRGYALTYKTRDCSIPTSTITKDEGTGYYQRYISRYTARNAVLDVGVTYQSSIGVSDPSVFDRNTTG